MKAMILAAGLGTRMAPLTDHLPKPLLQAGGRSLIEWHIRRLVVAGFKEIVINHFYLGAMLEQALGDGSALGARISWSPEQVRLETAGGIINALPLLRGPAGDESFIVVNGDIWTDFDFGGLKPLVGKDLAHLVLVPNALHHPQGDFHLRGNRVSRDQDSPQARLTFSGISVLSPALFGDHPAQPAPLLPFLLQAMERHAVSGERFDGRWWDIGTPQRLAELDVLLGSEPGSL
jgi:N-acetyl-alpha-D-muramate 1-phosphate uridylyltransferase